MQRFVLDENLRLFRSRLDRAKDEPTRLILSKLIEDALTELALLEAMEHGVGPSWSRARPEDLQHERDALRAWFHVAFDGTDKRAILIDPGPGLRVVDVAGDLRLAPGRSRLELVDRYLFEMFPNNPAQSGVPGIATFTRSMRTAAQTGREQQLPPYRHDILDAEGNFVERHWRGACRPLTSPEGDLVLLLGLIEVVADRPPVS